MPRTAIVRSRRPSSWARSPPRMPSRAPLGRARVIVAAPSAVQLVERVKVADVPLIAS